MKKLAIAIVVLASFVAVAATVSAIQLNTSINYNFEPCAVDGGAAQTVAAGTYLVRITAADTTVCQASTCASGGQTFPSGAILLLSLPQTSVSCRSGGTGNLYLTGAR